MTQDDTPTLSGPDEASGMSERDFAQWGAGLYAYAKRIRVDGQDMMAIYDTTGQRLGLASDPDAARSAILENDMEPLSLN